MCKKGDIYNLPFTDFNDCIRQVKEHLNQPGMGAVAVFHQKRLYIKKGVPEFSKYADVEEYIEGCHTFWVDPGLKDLSNEAKRL